MHSVMRGLAQGQRELGLAPVLVDRIGKDGSYSVSQCDPTLDLDGAVAEFHFAQGARPVLSGAANMDKFAQRVFHFHGPWAAEGRVQGDNLLKTAGKWLLEYDTYRRFSRFIAASHAFAEVLTRAYGIPARRIAVVHPGVDTRRFIPTTDRRDVRARLGLDPDRTTFVAVRRLEPRMGVGVAIEAMVQFPDAQLVIAGSGSLLETLRQQAAKLQVDDRTKLIGHVSDAVLPDIYHAADLVLVPSVALEGFGMVVLEALACGIPVVASRLGGLPEALGPFAADSCFEAGSVTDLVSTVSRHLKTHDDGQSLRAYAETRSLRAAAAEVEEVLLG